MTSNHKIERIGGIPTILTKQLDGTFFQTSQHATMGEARKRLREIRDLDEARADMAQHSPRWF